MKYTAPVMEILEIDIRGNVITASVVTDYVEEEENPKVPVIGGNGGW